MKYRIIFLLCFTGLEIFGQANDYSKAHSFSLGAGFIHLTSTVKNHKAMLLNDLPKQRATTFFF
ncbi:MAG: hypothetical protein LBT04_06580 [Prevotellaceae bacterium]|jgi:hypothetical protein|nr:hypothetical protein [Prevotellaceae bacterium]